MSNNPPAVLSLHEFLRDSKKRRIRPNLQGNGFVPGGSSTWQLEQAGLCSGLFVYLNVPITTNGAAAGTWLDIMNIAKRMRFRNNSSYNYRDLSGPGWHSWMRDRYGNDPYTRNGTADPYSVDFQTTVIPTYSKTGNPKPGAAVAASTTYNIVLALPMDVAYARDGSKALLVLPSDNLKYYLDIDWGNVADILTLTAGTATFGTPVLQVQQEIFMVPLGAKGRIGPRIDAYVSVHDEVQSITGNGIQQFGLQPNENFTTISLLCSNNNLPISAANIKNVKFSYSGEIIDIIEDLQIEQARQAWLNPGCFPQDGKIHLDYGTRLGGNNLRRDTYDAFRAQSVTGLKVEFDLGTLAIVQPASILAITESLKPFKQSA